MPIILPWPWPAAGRFCQRLQAGLLSQRATAMHHAADQPAAQLGLPAWSRRSSQQGRGVALEAAFPLCNDLQKGKG